MVSNVGGSGKFKKMMAKPDSYFQRKSAEEEKNQNYLFSRNYLDSTVSKLLVSDRRNKYSFLMTTRQSLQEEEENIRENVTRDWNHISETVQDLGIPEFADVIGGQMFAGGHVRHTTTCCLTLRLADNLNHLADKELVTCLNDVSVWPSDASTSDSLTAVFKSIDKELSIRCAKWDTVDNIQFALLWSRGPARTAEKLFEKRVLKLASKDILNLSLDDCLTFLLFCSYESKIASELVLGEEEKLFLESQLLKGLHSMSETEISLGYTSLSTILRHKSMALKTKIEGCYGFRL